MKKILSLLCAILLSIPAQMQASQPSNATMGGIAALGLGFGYFGYGAYKASQTHSKIKDLKQLNDDFPNVGKSGIKQLPIFNRLQTIRRSHEIATTYKSMLGHSPEVAVDNAREGFKLFDQEGMIVGRERTIITQHVQTESHNVFKCITDELPAKDQSLLSTNKNHNKESFNTTLDTLDRNYKLKTYGLAGLSALCLGGAAVVGWFGWKK